MHVIKLSSLPSLSDRLMCPECGSRDLHYNGTDLYCLNCSLVIVIQNQG